MGKDTKVVAYKSMNTSTSIFYKYGYGNGHYNILTIEYPLPFLVIKVRTKRLDARKPQGYRSFSFITDLHELNIHTAYQTQQQ